MLVSTIVRIKWNKKMAGKLITRKASTIMHGHIGLRASDKWPLRHCWSLESHRARHWNELIDLSSAHLVLTCARAALWSSFSTNSDTFCLFVRLHCHESFLSPRAPAEDTNDRCSEHLQNQSMDWWQPISINKWFQLVHYLPIYSYFCSVRVTSIVRPTLPHLISVTRKKW